MAPGSTTDTENQIVVEAWNTVLFDKFLRFRHILVSGLSGHSNELLARRPFRSGERVLDVGCGFGDCTIRIAGQVGSSGKAVGVDCAPRFIEASEQDAAAAGAGSAEFFVADVQEDDLRGPYDQAFARFGTMFFMSPVPALRNIRRALKPGGRLLQIVWRRREDNPWVYEAEMQVRAIVPAVSHEDTDQVHCGPGPFSMSGPDTVSAMMKAAGYSRIAFERHDADICIGRDLDEAVAFAIALGPAGEIIRLAESEAERLMPAITSALRDTLGRYARADGVWAPSSTWFISAINPA